MYSDLHRPLRLALDPAPTPTVAAGDRLAAVLALLVERPQPALVFTVRSSELSRHAGEVSFPGGLQDPGESLAGTALREAHEEIGLDPSTPILLGALSPVHTTVSGILVVPFVGVVGELPALTPSDREIERVVVAPIARLASVEAQVEYPLAGGRSWTGWVYEVEGATVWGATGRMLHELLEVLRTQAPWLI
ncbi:MAG TPA: CoA pyrophosphatase [Actinomycetota bacterium]|jgi:8-oxo-dGTP pyrophosphatase MutT (NUDIX family)